MADRELKLNSISRYSKQSQHLVLEEHSACEVPAGCGGVILRWRAADDPVPIRFSIVTRAEYATFLDGQPFTSARPLVAPGRRALALQLARSAGGELVLMLTGCVGRRAFSRQWQPGPQPAPLLRSLADGSWRYVTQEPPDAAWMLPGFDDTAWSPLVAQPPPAADEKTISLHCITGLQEDGAQAIGPTEDADRIWMRTEFSIPSEGGG